MITRNAVRCAHCGYELVSEAPGDYKMHTCSAMHAAAGTPYVGIAISGGLEKLHRVGNPAHYVEHAEYATDYDPNDWPDEW
jgi:hypothetical protein